MKKILFSLMISGSVVTTANSQYVGIGTNTPTEKLDVNGGIKIGTTNNTAKGTIRWNEIKSDFEGYNGVTWVSLTGSKGNWGNQQSYTTENSATQIYLYSDGTELGYSLALSKNILAAGARGNNTISSDAPYAGSVYLFEKTTTDWRFKKTIPNPTGDAGEYFGSSVCLDNNTLMVGAPGVDLGSQRNAGKAYIFHYDSATNQAILRSTLSASDADEGDGFGHSVAIQGNYAVAGAPYNSIGGINAVGRVYTFRYNGTSWLQQNVLTAPGGDQEDNFGYALTISGNWLAASAHRADIEGNIGVGKVHLYKLNSTGLSWDHISTLVPPMLTPYSNFGHSVHMSGDTLIVGAVENSGTTFDSAGKAYVYHRNGDGWNLHSILIPPDGKVRDGFGASIKISDGYVIIGARSAGVGANSYQGKAYIFKWNGSAYACEAILASSNGSTGDFFGTSVAIGPAGAVVGAPHAAMGDYNLENGRLYFFDRH